MWELKKNEIGKWTHLKIKTKNANLKKIIENHKRWKKSKIWKKIERMNKTK